MMPIEYDPEGNETAALRDMIDLTGQRVLEIGCGDGRLTWRYASLAAQVTAIDGDQDDIAVAVRGRPPGLRDCVRFVASTLLDFARTAPRHGYDVAILSWSL